MLLPPAQAWHLGDLLLPVPDLHMVHEQPRLHLLADQPARHRVHVAVRIDRLPESTFTCSRLADSMRRSGNSLITAISSPSRCLRPAFNRSNIAARKRRYSSTLPKSTLPRNINSCATARLKRWCRCSTSPFSLPCPACVFSLSSP